MSYPDEIAFVGVLIPDIFPASSNTVLNLISDTLFPRGVHAAGL